MNKLLLNLLALWVIQVVTSCSDSGSSAESREEHLTVKLTQDKVEGMIHVHSEGAAVFLGTDNLGARPVETPQMKALFTYEYSMGRHEVLCSDFNKLMKPAFGLQVDCPKDSIPASDLTFFDAVLYANEKSKSQKLDTNYTYTAAEFDSEKHCVQLTGFEFKADAEGFRLPSEAEWILAASQSWNPENSWHGDNSEGRVHEVCSFKTQDDLLCDMAGNLLEWVNDWQGTFRDTTVTNFVGAMDGGPLGSCVVKGGYFFTSPQSMTLYARGDTYPVLNSSRANYVGFRLAKGAIPQAVWMSGQGTVATTPVKSLVSKKELLSLTNSGKAKIAFRNDETHNLVYVNYGSSTPTIVEIEDSLNVFHPEISPDGRHVAFCTAMEGVSEKSSLYVRELNSTGSHLVKLDVDQAAIPRWRVNENGDTLIVYVSSADNNKKESFSRESTWQVRFSKGTFGKPEKLFDGAYHDGISSDERLAVTGSSLLRARMSVKGKTVDSIWYSGDQACNVSLANDGSKRTLFLDFGGKDGVSFANEKYGVHERILVADSMGKLVHMVPISGDYSFDHTEWATVVPAELHNHWVISSLTNINGSHHQIAMVNLADSSVVPVLEGGELWHPSMWLMSKTKDSSALDLDSAGVYFKNDGANPFIFSSVELAIKLRSFWKMRDEVEVVALGSSMLMDAVIDDSIKSYKTLNMGVTLTDVHIFQYLVRNYVIPFAPKVKVLVVELAPGLLFRSEEDMLKYLVEFSPGIRYDEKHLSSETVSEIAENSLEQEYPMDLFSQQYMEGTFLLPSVSWNVPSVEEGSEYKTLDSEKLSSSLAAFGALIQLADSCGIKVVAAITPRNPGYNKSEYYGYFGPTKDVAHKIIDEIAGKGVILFDENKEGLHDYTDKMAFNTNHVSYLGALQFTARLDSLLKTLK